jgi:hypothetical protein
MCPNCKKNTFSAWDKVKSTKARECSECGAFVKPAFFRSALSLLIATFISTIGGIITLDIVMKQIGPISFTYIWVMAIPFIIGSILPIIPWIKVNDWFVPWVLQKV